MVWSRQGFLLVNFARGDVQPPSPQKTIIRLWFSANLSAWHKQNVNPANKSWEFVSTHTMHIQPFVLMLDGISEHVSHTYRKIRSFHRKKVWFLTALYLIKYLKQKLLLACTPFSELPSYISTVPYLPKQEEQWIQKT